MRSKLCLLLLILTSNSACKGHLPIRPEVDTGMVSAPAPTPANPTPFHGCIFATPGGAIEFQTFEQCDKTVAIKKIQFDQFADYVNELETIAAAKGCTFKNGPTVTEDIRAFSDRYTLLLRGR